MKSTGKIKIDRRLLIVAAIISILLSILNFLSLKDRDYLILIRTVLPTLLLFAALYFPTMIYSTVMAGIGAFWSVLTVFFLPSSLLLTDLTAPGSELCFPAFMVLCVIGLIFAGLGAAEAVVWIRELRDRKKRSNATEGMDQMTRGLVTFLRPRQGMAIMCLIVCLLLMSMMFTPFSTGMLRNRPFERNDILFSNILLATIPPIGALIAIFVIIREIRRFDRYIKDLQNSELLSQAVFDYYRGKVFCSDHVIIGTKYILTEGAGRIVDCGSITKIYHSRSDSVQYGHWHLCAEQKDGTDVRLFELPYPQTQKCYDEFVLPILREISRNNADIVIDGPGEFRK